MSDAKLTVALTVRDLASVKLLLVRLNMLRDEMRVMASPHAGELDRIIEAFERGISDGGPND